MTEITAPRCNRAARAMSYERRVKAAGLSDDVPEDTDQFRYDLARRIVMFINDWHGCPELLCRRNRGCMAPNIGCSNAKELPAEEADRCWREARPGIYQALKAHLAASGAQGE